MTEPNTNTRQKFYSIAPFFFVDDIVQSAEFYRDKLGFRFDRFWGRPPSFVMVYRDGVTLMLKSLGSSGNSRPTHKTRRRAFAPRGNSEERNLKRRGPIHQIVFEWR
jgi:catechol 2,3-dioxygenase-like lactoylglutathione lyase family enzyme